MNKIKSIFALLAIALFAACAEHGATSIGNPNGPSTTEVIIGGNGANGGSGGEATFGKAFTEKYISENPVQQASFSAGSDIIYDIALVRFEPALGKLFVSRTEAPELLAMDYSVSDGGAVSAHGDGVELSADIVLGSNLFPLDIRLTSTTKAETARALPFEKGAPLPADDIFNGEAMCKEAKKGCFDSDEGLKGDAKYYVSGFVTTKGKNGAECALSIYDHCVKEGESLVDISCAESAIGYKMNLVYCNCKNGKCVEDISDTPKEAAPWDEDVCEANAYYCKWSEIKAMADEKTINAAKMYKKSLGSPFTSAEAMRKLLDIDMNFSPIKPKLPK